MYSRIRNPTITMAHLFNGDELLIAVFSYFPEGQVLRFKEDIAHAFYEACLHGKGKYKDFFSGYHFDNDGVVVYSPEIEGGLDDMMLSGMRSTASGVPNTHIFTGLRRAYDTRIRQKISEPQAALVAELAEDLKTRLLR